MSIRYAHDLFPRTNPRDGALVRRLAKLNEAQFEAVRNGTGSGLIKTRGIGADAAAIDPRGLQLVRVSQINTDVVNGLTLSGFDEQVIHGYWLEQGDFEALDRMRLRKLSFGGAGMLAYLEREHHWSHSYLSEINPAFGTMDPFDGIFRWWNQGDWAGGDFLGAILWRGMSEGLAFRVGATYTHRHADGLTYTDAHDDDKLNTGIPYLVLDFDQFVDSNGNAWVVPSGEFESPVGETLYTFATRLMAAGLYIELDPVTFALRAWEVAKHGRNRTGLAWGANVLRFNPPPPPSTSIGAGNILGDLKRAVRPLIRATSLLTGGRDIYGLATQAGDVPWHRFHADDAGEVAALSAVASRQLGARNDAGDTVQVPAKTGNDPVNGYYLPFVHAQLDDLVTLHSGAETWDWTEAAYPLAKIAVKSLRSSAPSVIYHLGASYHSTGDRRFDGGAGVGRHTHLPNPQLCSVHETFRVTKLYRFAANGHEFGHSAPSAAVLHTHASGGLVTETTSENLGTVGPFEVGSIEWYFKDTTCGSTFPWNGSQHVLRENGPLAAGPEAWKPALPAGAYRLYFLDGDTICSTTRGTPSTGDNGSNFVVQIEPSPSALFGHSPKAARCDHLHNIEDLLTTETNTALVPHPDGSGGVVWGPGGLAWFNVTDYGAVGDGTTDDTAAINSAIAALNTAARGRLYFPAGTYKCTAALTTITADALIFGDGRSSWDGTTAPTKITCTSATAALFTINGDGCTMADLALVNTSVGAPSAGAGVTITGGYGFRLRDCSVGGFYINVDMQVGSIWSMRGCYLISPVLYNLKHRNTASTDEGDASIAGNWFYTKDHAATAHIRIESAGGIRIHDNYFNRLVGYTNYVNQIIDIAVAAGVSTSQIRIHDNSMEVFRKNGINITTTPTSSLDSILIANNQINAYFSTAGTARAINVVVNTINQIDTVIIEGNSFRACSSPVSSVAAIYLEKVNNVLLSNNLIDGPTYPFASMLETSGCTNVKDYSIPLVSGAAAGGDLSGTFPNPSVVDDSHAHTVATLPTPATSSQDHVHIVDEAYSGDGVVTVFTLANEAELESAIAYVGGTRTSVTVGGSINDQITFAAAPAVGTDNISIDYVAVAT